MRTSLLDNLKRAFRVLTPAPALFLLGLFFVLIGLYGVVSPSEPAALDDLPKSTVFATKMVYRSNAHGSNYWELETRPGLGKNVRYRIEPQPGCEKLKARIDGAPLTIPPSEDGETVADPVKGVYVDIWVEPRSVFGVVVSRHVVQAEIDGERIFTYTPETADEIRSGSVKGFIFFSAIGLFFILLPIVGTVRSRKTR